MKTISIVAFLIFLSLAFSALAANGITYSQISNVQTQLLESLLNRQLPDGAFMLSTFPLGSRFQVGSTLSSLVMLKKCGFPMATSAFQKGIKFLLNNYDPFEMSALPTFYTSLGNIETLGGGTKVKLSKYANLIKDAACSSYLNDILFLSESNRIKSSKKLKQIVLFSLPTIFSTIRNSTKAELTSWMSPNAVNKNAAFISDMANLYEAVSKLLTKSFTGENGSFVLAYMVKLDECTLNSYDKKMKNEMFDYGIKDILKSSLANKIQKKLISFQEKNGSWSWKLALSSVGFSSTSTISTMSTSIKRSLRIQTTALNLDTLLESGVPATSQIIKKGISYLITELPRSLQGKTPLEEISQPFITLEIYSQKIFGKKYTFKLLPSRYVKFVSANNENLSKLLSNLYVGKIKEYIQGAIFSRFFGKNR